MSSGLHMEDARSTSTGGGGRVGGAQSLEAMEARRQGTSRHLDD